MSQNEKLKVLVVAIVADGKLDQAEVKNLQVVLYADGRVDITELNTLFEIKNAVAAGDNAPEWAELFVKAGTDAVLGDANSPSAVDEEEAQMLIDLIGDDGNVDTLELALLVNICGNASSCDETLVFYTLDAIKEAILVDGKVDANEVEMLRTVIYGAGGSGGVSVTKEELEVLFAINDATKGADNAPEWQELFVKAGTDAYLEDGILDTEEANELITLIGADGSVSELEKALVANIMASGSTVDPAFQAFAASL